MAVGDAAASLAPLMKKALLKVGYSCNSNCVFCHSRFLRGQLSLSMSQLKERISQVARRGAEMVVFSGGEPTIRADIVELARYVRSLGLGVGLITNGRRFVYPAFGEELMALGLSFVYMSFHSHRPGTHDLTTQTASFRQTLAALRNLAKLELDLTINIIVTRRNIEDLPEVIDFLAPFKPARIKLSVVEPKGAAFENPSIVPPLSAAAAAIGAALRHGRSRYPGQRFGCEGLTPCLLDGFDELVDDLFTNAFSLFQESFEAAPSPPDNRNRGKPRTCVDCSRFEDCPGVFTGYLSAADPLALKPLLRRRSNSFVFMNDGGRLPMPSSARACMGRKENARSIYIRDGGLLRVWRTPTNDFSEAEISRTRGLGQLYVSARGRHASLDYSRDLIKLRVSALCSRCKDREDCSRLYEPTARKVFTCLESRLRKLVRGLRGDIMEVGCGSVRFRKIIESGVRAKRITYVGIDPDLPHAPEGESFRTPEVEGMVLRRCAIEEFEAADASLDHILLLRSYNHLRQPSVIFPKLRRMLRQGGRLIVVDGAAFGLALARRPAQAAPGAFHHYRNHTSQQARGLLEAMGFLTDREWPVALEGGTEWLLELKKI